MVALLVLLTVLVFLSVDYFVQRRSAGAAVAAVQPALPPVAVRPDPGYRTPPGVYFDRGHTWAFLEESGDIRMGVNDLARVVVGRVDRIDTAPRGKRIRKGDVVMELVHGDRRLALHSPIDARLEAPNPNALSGHGDALTDGWICRLKPDDTAAVPEQMLIGNKANEWLHREVRRLKVFLATVAPEHPVLSRTMADGGLPYGGLVDHLNDGDWHKLQETFFDPTSHGPQGPAGLPTERR
jgi:glycine cleavage system H lipoate-binding protein